MTHLTINSDLASIEDKSEEYNILYDSKTLLFKKCLKKVLDENKKKEKDSNKKKGSIDKENIKSKNKTFNEKDKENKKVNINIISEIKGKIEDDNTDKHESNKFLCKKRNLFKIDYPSDFSVFNYGEYSKYSRQIINEVLDYFYHNSSEKTINDINAESGDTKKINKKIKNVQKRKENSDNIRKKIKSRFLKVLKNTVNERLKTAGSKKFFKFLPQKFVSNITKEKNKVILDLTFKDLFSKNFFDEKKENETHIENYYHNLQVLDYLEQNDDISEKSNFNIIKNMKFRQIFNEYLKSKEFEMEIELLKQEKESDKYIKDYIFKACDLIDFFSN